MANIRLKTVLLFLGGALALSLLALPWDLGAGSSEAQEGAMHECPQPGKWALSVWSGDDGTDVEQALATCGVGAVDLVYYLDTDTQLWSRWAQEYPEISDLVALDNWQAVIALGSVGAAASLASASAPLAAQNQVGTMHNCPQPGKWALSIWEGLDGTETDEALATCGERLVVAAYAVDPQTQAWKRWFLDRPEISTLTELNNKQAVFAVASTAEELCGPVIPGTYYGAVAVDGAPAPDGTTITVSIDGVDWAATTTSGGQYVVDIPASPPVEPPCFPGAGTVTFDCDGTPAAEFDMWWSGLRQLHLTCGAVPTPSPTPIPSGFHPHYACRQRVTGLMHDTGVNVDQARPDCAGGWEPIQILVKH